MGDSAANADNECDFLGIWARWGESRSKKYVTSASERTMLLSQNWRDDGIAFYVPSAAAAGTRSVYTTTKVDNIWVTRYYYVDGAEATLRGKAETGFQVLTAAAADTQPLIACSTRTRAVAPTTSSPLARGASIEHGHRAISSPIRPALGRRHSPTTLVVEALADGCPYQGFFGAASEPARDVYPAWLTLDQLRAASPTGEVYINGEHTAGVNPKPVARSFMKIAPWAEAGSRLVCRVRRRQRDGNSEGHAVRGAELLAAVSKSFRHHGSVVHVRRNRSLGAWPRFSASCGSTSAMSVPT